MAGMLDPARRPFLAGFLLALISGLCLWLAFPPAGQWAMSLIALAPLARLIACTTGPWRSGLGAGLGFLPQLGLQHWWMLDVTVAGTPALMLVLACYPFAVVVTCAGIRRRVGDRALWIALPVAWTGAEFVQGEIAFHGYPWYLLGQPLIDAPVIPVVASMLGVYGVSFIAALVGTSIGLALGALGAGHRTRGVSLLVRAAVVTSLTIGCAVLAHPTRWRAPEPPTTGAVIAAIQSNVPQSNKMAWSMEQRLQDLIELSRLTRAAADASPAPELIVWPETMFPGYTLDPETLSTARTRIGAHPYFVGFAERTIALQREIGIPILVGATGIDGFVFHGPDAPVAYEAGAVFNSVFLLESGEVRSERYDKVHLTPFGEVMPYISAFDWLERALLSIGASGMSFELARGEEPHRFVLDSGLVVATPICFESTMGGVCRSLVLDASGSAPPADVLVNVTNDGWFGASDAGRRTHLMLGRWRCVELGVPMIRAANTGFSAIIDARGRLMDVGPAREATWVSGPVPESLHAGTVYRRAGDAFGLLNLLAWAGLLIGPVVCSRLKSPPPAEPIQE